MFCTTSFSRSIRAFLLFAFGWTLLSPLPAIAAGNSLQGHVVTLLAPTSEIARLTKSSLVQPAATSLIAPIYLPDIEVWVKNSGTRVTSPHAVSNPQGYFVIVDLPEGRYQVCASGTGFTAMCEDRVVSISRPAQVLDHFVDIQPAGNALSGTVRLADRVTPCFWYQQAIDPKPLLAKVSLLDASQHVVAGPVRGNTTGVYVLPVAGDTTAGTLHVECESAVIDSKVQIPAGVAVHDVAVDNRAPTISSMDFATGGMGIRRADPGTVVQVTVLANDLDGDSLHYQWFDDSGRPLALPDAPSVDWPLPNAAMLNAIHVQVYDGKGGVATFRRSIAAGPNSLLFAGRVFDRKTLRPVSGASVKINAAVAHTDSGGQFSLPVSDAPQFVLNVNQPGYALASLIFRTVADSISVPLDAAQSVTVNGATGGTVQIAPAGACVCRCAVHRRDSHHRESHGDRVRHERKGEVDYDGHRDRDDDRKGRDDDDDSTCASGEDAASISVTIPPGALLSATGTRFNGSVSIEGFQYDLAQTNPIPGDFGGTYQGKAVRLGSYGAVHIQPRDAQGHPLTMTVGKTASISIPIQAAQLATAPSIIPFFHYDQTQGLWIEDGTLTRSGARYVGNIKHFSAFNADTVFPGGACVKVVIDNSFVPPVTLTADYFDTSVGSFNHNGYQTSDLVIGVERMVPFQNFNLTIKDSHNTSVTVPLNSGPGLPVAQFPGGLDTDQINFSHCNGPVQVYNNTIPAARPPFLTFVSTPSAARSANYQKATDAQAGGTRDTLAHWKQANGFPAATGEATAIYFNNGDLKFGRDMHCRVTNAATHATACYVSNFGNVGTDDAPTAFTDAASYEASGQKSPQPVATVTMEYDPVKGVQFWAYHGEVVTAGVSDGGKYLANPALDSQGPKFIPDICMGCHMGTYANATCTAQPCTGVVGAAFLPFDLDSFKDVTGALFPVSTTPPSAAAQTNFHQLNLMVANTNPPSAVGQLVNQLWYANATPTTPFTFNQGAANLTGKPFLVPGAPVDDHAPLYDNVVKEVCRTCHVAITGLAWNSFSLMQSFSTSIQGLACGPASAMPNAEVPWLSYWKDSRSSTLISELNFPVGGTGCPNQ